jgi:hypothetical protein
MTRRSALAVLFVFLASCGSLRLFEVQDQDTLYFGTSRVNAAAVSDAEWRDFVEQVVVPAFPGFTEVEGTGYWKGQREASRMIVVVHPRSGEDNGKIQHIIDEYKRRFQQEAVFWTKSAVDVPMD